MEKWVERVKKIANLMMRKGNFSPAMMLMIEKNFKEMSIRIMELEDLKKRNDEEEEEFNSERLDEGTFDNSD